MSAYRKGYRAERELMEYMILHENCVCMRSAGSHSPIDVLAGNGEKVYAIQVKYGKRRVKVDLEDLRLWAKMFNAIPCVATKRPYGKWNLEMV